MQLGLNLKRKRRMDSKHSFHFTNMCHVCEGLGKELQVSYERLARKNACDFEQKRKKCAFFSESANQVYSKSFRG